MVDMHFVRRVICTICHVARGTTYHRLEAASLERAAQDEDHSI
jgi:hypothetical protein